MSLPLSTPAAIALRSHLSLIATDTEAWIDLFQDDAVMEFPFSAMLGLPTSFRGKEAIADHIRRMTTAMYGLKFSEVRIYPAADPSIAFAEFHADALVGPDKQPYAQDYIAYLHLEHGGIAKYREYWDPIRVQGAMTKAASASGGVQS